MGVLDAAALNGRKKVALVGGLGAHPIGAEQTQRLNNLRFGDGNLLAGSRLDQLDELLRGPFEHGAVDFTASLKFLRSEGADLGAVDAVLNPVGERSVVVAEALDPQELDFLPGDGGQFAVDDRKAAVAQDVDDGVGFTEFAGIFRQAADDGKAHCGHFGCLTWPMRRAPS